MIENILCDMDGVLSDFLSLALERMERMIDDPAAPLTPDSYAIIGEFDIAKVYGISATKFWETIEHGDQFWCNLKPFPWAKELVRRLGEIAPVTICTSPSLHPKCATQKVEWMTSHLGLKNTDMMIGGRKHLMAKPGNLLIDDWCKNTDKFKAHGGDAICVPSNWNTYQLTLEKVWAPIDAYVSELAGV